MPETLAESCIEMTFQFPELSPEIRAMFKEGVNVDEVFSKALKEHQIAEDKRPKTLEYKGELLTRQQYQQIIDDNRSEADKVMRQRANNAFDYQNNIKRANDLKAYADNLERGLDLMTNIFQIADERQEQARVNALQDRASKIQREATARKEARTQRIEEIYAENFAQRATGISREQLKAEIGALLDNQTSGKNSHGSYRDFSDNQGRALRLYSHDDGGMSLVSDGNGGSNGA